MELNGLFINGERALFSPDNILVGLDDYIEDTIDSLEAQTKTVTGRMVTIDDAAGYKKVAAITVEPKNLIKYTNDWDRFVTLERNGVLFTMDYDYGLTLSGQATGYSNTEYVLSTELPAGNYVLTGGVSEKIYLQATVGGTDLAQDTGNGVNFVVNDGDTFRLKLCILPGTFCNDGDYKQRVLPMVRAANIIADDNYYEPPAVDFVEISQAGKNLLDVTLTNKFVSNGITVIPNEDGSFTVYGTNTKVNEALSIPLGKFEGKNNFSYILSGCPSDTDVTLKASGNVSINTISGTSVAAHTTTSYVYTDTGEESNPIIFPSGINRYDVSLEIAAGAENVDTVVWPMIRLNNPAVDSSFEKSHRINYIFKSTGNIFADTDVHPFASKTNFWSRHGNVTITYYTPSTTSLSEALEEIAQKLPIAEPMPPHPGVTNEFHILPYDRQGTDALRLLSYNRDGSVGVVTMPNVHTLVNTDIYDACHILTIVNTYLRHADLFAYGNPGTPQFEGDFRNPTLQTPATSGGKFYIDCAMFAQLVGHGIIYEDSLYNNGNNKAIHPMFDQLGEAVKPYWLTSTTEPDHLRLGNSYTSLNRMTSYALAKYFYDCGKFKPVQDVDDIPVGALVFSGSSSARFKGIGHVFVVVSRIGSGRSKMLIAEATSGVSSQQGANQAIVVRPLPSSYTIQGYVIPPCTGSLARVRFSGLYDSTIGGQMALRHTGVSFAGADGQTYTHHVSKLSSFVVAICPESNDAYDLRVSLEPAASGTFNEGISNSLVTSSTSGPYVVHVPFGYKLTLKSSALKKNTSDPVTFTVHRMNLLTDREITVPLVPMN